ncbi:MAG: hypothetical protein ACETVR_00635 [Candidatus Bathyarchaeia archaeon]
MTLHLPEKHSFSGLLGKKTLITGTVRTGKTKLTVDLLEEAVGLGYSALVTVIDMAPESVTVGGKSIGGRLSEFTEACQEVRYLTPHRVETPRLTAKSAEELLNLVRLNAGSIKPLLEEYIEEPSPILFVNDISIYLQSGSTEPVLEAMVLAETFIANGYYGEYFREDLETGVSGIEREMMDQLASHMDTVIRLSAEANEQSS